MNITNIIIYSKRMIDKELTIKQNEYVIHDYCFMKNIFFFNSFKLKNNNFKYKSKENEKVCNEINQYQN